MPKFKPSTKQLYCVSGRQYYTKLDTALKNALEKLMKKIKEPCYWNIRLVPKQDGYAYEATNDYYGSIKSRSVKIRVIHANNLPIDYVGS